MHTTIVHLLYDTKSICQFLTDLEETHMQQLDTTFYHAVKVGARKEVFRFTNYFPNHAQYLDLDDETVQDWLKKFA